MSLGYRTQKRMRGESNVRKGKTGQRELAQDRRQAERERDAAPERYRLWHDAGEGRQAGGTEGGVTPVEEIERRLEEWRREDLRERRRETLWNFAVNMIVALAALIVALKA